MMTTACRSDPPQCCQPLTDEEWRERSERLAAAKAAAYAQIPPYCPRCGGDSIAPVFDVSGSTFDCECGYVFEATT